MTNGNQQEAETDPFRVLERPDETDGEYVRMEAVMYPPPGEPMAETDYSHRRWGLDNGEEHVHPKQEEWFKVRSGKLRVTYEGTDRTLEEGEEITLPKNVPHTHWNPTSEPTRILWERRPGLRSDEWLETNYALAQAGRTDADGVPDSLLQLAVWMNEYPNDTYATIAPVGLLRVTFALLAPVGRALGYQGRYTREDIAELRE